MASRTSAELDEVVKEIEEAGGEGLAAQVNVGDWGSVEAAVYRATNFTGGALDVLVNCAGTFSIAPFDKMTHELWARAIDVNLTGSFSVTLEALDALEESGRGHVFNVCSVAAKRGFPGNTAYCASKYGLRGFGDALREDVRETGIRVTNVFPGPTDTTIWNKVEGDWDRSQMNRAEDVADAVWTAFSAPAEQDVDEVDVVFEPA